MKKTEKKIVKIVIIVAILAILLTGGIMIGVAKFNFSLDYAAHQRIEIFIGKTYEVNDIENMVKEVLGNQKAEIQEVEVFHDMVAISTKEMTEEQQDQLLQKINEKYGTELTKEEAITVYEVPAYRIRDMLSPYIWPAALIGVLVLLYVGARYAKLGIIKMLAKTLGLAILTVALYMSLIAILRIPLQPVIIPLGIAITIIVMVLFFNKQEKKLEKIEKEQKKKK